MVLPLMSEHIGPVGEEPLADVALERLLARVLSCVCNQMRPAREYLVA